MSRRVIAPSAEELHERVQQLREAEDAAWLLGDALQNALRYAASGASLTSSRLRSTIAAALDHPMPHPQDQEKR